MEFETLEKDNVTGRFDLADRILRIRYYGKLTPQATTDVYAWFGRLIVQGGGNINLALGSIYDFRDVSQFDTLTLSTAQRSSTQFNRDTELKFHPVALVVKTMFQQEYVRLTMKITPQEERKRIVKTIEEGEEFIAAFIEKFREQIPGLQV